MKTMRILAAGAFATCLSVPAFAATDLRVNINLGNAPPPPVYVVQHPPRTVWLPEERVYVVNDADFDDDFFQFNGFWFVYRDNYWYRARSWRGPFNVIEPRYVPQAIYTVPARRWKHHPLGGPPGQMKRAQYVEHRGGEIERVRVVDHGDHGRDNGGNGKDHGNGKGKGHK